ncbi:MAG: ATP-binding protein, partial [Verrucomicrobiaceae bacterium]
VLSSFVRNQLIDTVYLPVVGDNLAKQIGAAGDAKRTDRMGLLLLVSPPGYGKTTLLEYVASRLGIVFMKVNGPAIGHRVTSLDPAEAPNAAAREELNKLNLAFEMGDNVMICLDDIQHLNPEFLQKFISLCDGQRRIEGVYRGEPKTYDLRGKKVVVVMAGNPYTESGEKFRIPDMLSNRADTYNLGDMIGGHGDAFRASFIENSATSNRTLARLAARSSKDIYTALQLAENGPREGLDFEGNYSPEELSEVVDVLKKLLKVRDVVLRVNEEYIRSAGQADAYRTEPPFKLQGSYRNMNRLAEKISPVMNDSELETLLQDHYRNEAQTLTTGAEANLLKLREITDKLTPEEAKRWEEIKATFRKNQLLQGGDERDPITQVVRQLSACFDAIDSIKQVLAAGLKDPAPAAPPVTLIMSPQPMQATPLDGVAESAPSIREISVSQEALKRIWEVIEQTKPQN